MVFQNEGNYQSNPFHGANIQLIFSSRFSTYNKKFDYLFLLVSKNILIKLNRTSNINNCIFWEIKKNKCMIIFSIFRNEHCTVS